MTGWRDGDPLGRRERLALGSLRLESGAVLPDVQVAYETWGELSDARDNAVLVCHALTGDSHVSGPTGPGHPTPGWWDGVVGPGRALDPREWFVVAPNVLGGCQGTTGPSSAAPDGRPWGSRFPQTTIRDQVAVERAVLDALGIDQWAAVLGGSMGGMRALEWAATHPGLLRSALVLAASAAASAEQIAWCATQLLAIRADPLWQGGDYHHGPGPVAGLGLARRIAHVTYRSEPELTQRFGRALQPGRDVYAVESYLDHQADKLVGRFDAGSYVVLTEAMNSHDVWRGRDDPLGFARERGVEAVVVAIDSDRLYPPAQQAEVAALLGTQLVTIHSAHGHDGFLIEAEQVGAVVTDLLTRVREQQGSLRPVASR